MTNRGMAKDTLDILAKKEYINPQGFKVFLSKDIEYCLANTAFYTSQKLDIMTKNPNVATKFETVFEVVNSTTLSSILRTCSKEDNQKIMCLNFASAKNPGGGFMSGAEAQEESLARTSALYLSQLEAREFYVTHRNMKSCLYTDAMIYSAKTPVLRKDRGELLPTPVYCNFITSAAVNAGVVKRQEPDLVDSIEDIMFTRIDKMLALALSEGNEILILGAWGCGVFRNDPALIASLFQKHFQHKYKNAFRKVIFAIYTKNENLIQIFQKI
jgi:uncharacterized protein (TIGR02452 family)